MLLWKLPGRHTKIQKMYCSMSRRKTPHCGGMSIRGVVGVGLQVDDSTHSFQIGHSQKWRGDKGGAVLDDGEPDNAQKTSHTCGHIHNTCQLGSSTDACARSGLLSYWKRSQLQELQLLLQIVHGSATNQTLLGRCIQDSFKTSHSHSGIGGSDQSLQLGRVVHTKVLSKHHIGGGCALT